MSTNTDDLGRLTFGCCVSFQAGPMTRVRMSRFGGRLRLASIPSQAR